MKNPNQDKKVNIELDGDETLSFIVTREHFSDFINSTAQPDSDKLRSMNELLINTSTPDSKAKVIELCSDWANLPLLGGELVERCNATAVKLAKKPTTTAKA